MATKWMAVAVLACVLLAGCAVTPGDERPAGVNDPKEDLVEHLKDSPQDLDAHADLMRLQIRDGDETGARTTMLHALKHNPGDYRAHLIAAQFHRWQADLINAERSLVTARDLAPQRLEPRVALSGLYNQTYLETEELEQRRIAYELSDPAWRDEFLLDYAYSCAQLGHDELARELAGRLAADRAASVRSRARAWLLLSELMLRVDNETESATALRNAWRLQPTETGLVQFAARLVTVLNDPEPLREIFKQTLDTQDIIELRWAAIFGKWMLALQGAAAAGTDPLSPEAEVWWLRLENIAATHPDALTRRVQVLSLFPERAEQADAAREALADAGLGAAAAGPATMQGLLRLWRAEDALRLGAPEITLDEVTQLEVRDPDVEGLRVLRMVALFKAREDDSCLSNIEAWVQEAGPDDLVMSMRWWILLRRGESRQVLVELEAREDRPNNATLWIEAVARFHLYRDATRPE